MWLQRQVVLLLCRSLYVVLSLPLNSENVDAKKQSYLVNLFKMPRSSEGTAQEILNSRERRSADDTEERPKKISEQNIIKEILLDYDWRVRPRGDNDSWIDTGGPVVVSVNIYLRSISKIDDVNMEYSAQFTFREQWTDPRLAYAGRPIRLGSDEKAPKEVVAEERLPPFVVLATSEQGPSMQQIWMPDTFFQNEKEARRHLIDKPNVLIRIYPDGAILYSVRLSLVLSCPMSLEYYPLDHQTCKIELASYAYTTTDIKYEWKKERPIQQKEGLKDSLPSFELQNVETDYCTSKTNTGEYSCLRTKLILRREFSYYLLQLYIPSFMLVIVSWVSFWLDKDSVPARVTLGVTTLLTMTTQSSGINAKLPPVSYTKAIDVWIGVCLAFIFGALLEFALVNYAARKDMMNESRSRGRRMGGGGAGPVGATTRPRQSTAPQPLPTAIDNDASNVQMRPLLSTMSPPEQTTGGGLPQQRWTSPTINGRLLMADPNAAQPTSPLLPPQPQRPPRAMPPARRPATGCMEHLFRKYKERSKRIDVVSRVVFPTGFLIFNFVYWAVYLIE